MTEPVQPYPPRRRTFGVPSGLVIGIVAFSLGVGISYWGGSLWSTLSQPVKPSQAAPGHAQSISGQSLADELGKLGPALLTLPAKTRMMDKIEFYVERLIFVRDANSPSEIAMARVEQAQKLIAEGRIPQAVALVDSMPGHEVAIDWRARALAFAQKSVNSR